MAQKADDINNDAVIALEIMTELDQKEWQHIGIMAWTRRDENGDVWIDNMQIYKSGAMHLTNEPLWKRIIRKLLDIK